MAWPRSAFLKPLAQLTLLDVATAAAVLLAFSTLVEVIGALWQWWRGE